MYGQHHALDVLEELGPEVVPVFPKQNQFVSVIGPTEAEETTDPAIVG